MPNKILVIGEIANGKIRCATFECITKAREISEGDSSKVSLLLFGKDLKRFLPEISGFGIKRVYLLENECLENYFPESVSELLSRYVSQFLPEIILLPATCKGKDLAPRLAARLKTALVGDCIEIELKDSDTTIFTRPIFAGKLLGRFNFLEKTVQIATLRPKIVQIKQSPPDTPEVVELTTEPFPLLSKKRFIEIRTKEEQRLDIQEADIVIAGGRGLGSAENFKILEELANLLGGAVGASRAAVDAGWKAHSCQVGQTGKTIVPKLYIACGISGSMQHLAGISSSKCIVAINKDPDAPIFKKADYGIVGDLFKIVPLLIKELKGGL